MSNYNSEVYLCAETVSCKLKEFAKSKDVDLTDNKLTADIFGILLGVIDKIPMRSIKDICYIEIMSENFMHRVYYIDGKICHSNTGRFIFKTTNLCKQELFESLKNPQIFLNKYAHYDFDIYPIMSKNNYKVQYYDLVFGNPSLKNF